MRSGFFICIDLMCIFSHNELNSTHKTYEIRSMQPTAFRYWLF